MSMIVLRCLILTELLTVSYTAPKLGPLHFDPLAYEAAMFTKKYVTSKPRNDVIRRFLRMQDKDDKTTKKPCLGYDYDENLCKIIGDRIVCGYNKNIGQPTNTETTVDIGNGCFIRGDRVECGYVTGQSPNLRGRSTTSQHSSDKESTVKPKTTIDQKTTLKSSEVITTKVATVVTERLTSKSTVSTSSCNSSSISTYSTSKAKTTASTKITELFTNKPTTAVPRETTKTGQAEQINTTTKPKFKCVDKDNSIFCYELNEVK